MAGQIIANASKLFALDDGLKNTTLQIDSVIADNDEIIRNTKEQISDVLSVWKERQAQAYERLASAQEALTSAEADARNIVTTVEKRYKGHHQRKRHREGFFSKSASAKPKNVR